MCRWFDSGQSHQCKNNRPLGVAPKGLLFLHGGLDGDSASPARGSAVLGGDGGRTPRLWSPHRFAMSASPVRFLRVIFLRIAALASPHPNDVVFAAVPGSAELQLGIEATSLHDKTHWSASHRFRSPLYFFASLCSLPRTPTTLCLRRSLGAPSSSSASRRLPYTIKRTGLLAIEPELGFGVPRKAICDVGRSLDLSQNASPSCL
jgi:hypothetical protein